MTQRFLVVDDSWDLSSLGRRELEGCSHLLLLSWVAPDTLERLRLENPSCRPMTLPEIVGGLRRWEEEAVELVEQVCAGSPSYRGQPWCGVLAEGLNDEARTVQAVLEAAHCCRQLTAEGETARIELRVADDVEQTFRDVAGAVADLEIVGARNAVARRAGFTQRMARRLRHASLVGGWRSQARNLLVEADRRYRLRLAAGRRLSAPHVEPGGVTFFSSYRNNSRILSALEPHLAVPVTWITANASAREGAHSKAFHRLWRFAPAELPAPIAAADPPSPEARDAARQGALRSWLSWSPTWRFWRETGHALLPRLTACWERYLDLARPGLVVVAGNWGLDGWLARLARERGTPVLQLLHGLLDGVFYTEGPLHADALIVWGEFWRRQWPAATRPRVHVFNPGIVSAPARPRAAAVPPRVTFFSWPFDRLRFYSGSELLDGMIALFQRLSSVGACRLTVRAHPQENLSDLAQRWRRRSGELPSGLRLSRSEPLEEVLAETDLAVMFRSTVMLDCLAHGIPVLIPGWIEFHWSQGLEGIEGIHLATDFRDLGRTLEDWLESPPRIDPGTVRRFVRPAGEGRAAFEELVTRLVGRRDRAPAGTGG